MNKILVFLLIAGLVLAGTVSAVQEISEQASTEPPAFSGESPTTLSDDGSTSNQGTSGGGGSGSAPIPG
ncbi:MAG: hypothetical protein HXS41_04910 [Theionarchaea archaeon]|nr:hypothetical protein [Theionarchaea archaeon]MBU6999621.1 hypothetical protein [Theionarchaea archaeon]MBU7020375.1 hypothetical protein [Theionarchaea archaeon]MBU7035324.1 hypothetical protein [Theionarchaea archaeon]MBU7041473.1 hypothetical protein [Theionarchaea archaeon]